MEIKVGQEEFKVKAFAKLQKQVPTDRQLLNIRD